MDTEAAAEINDNLDQLFQDQDYNTDAKHFLPKLSERMDNDLSLWRGHYRLSSENPKIHLVIGAKLDATSKEETKVYLNGMLLKNYTFKEAVLKWDDTQVEGGGTGGELRFNSYFHHDTAETISVAFSLSVKIST